MAALSGGAEIAPLPTITIHKATVDDEKELGLRLEAILRDVCWRERHRKARTSFLPTSSPAVACISRLFYYGKPHFSEILESSLQRSPDDVLG